MTNSGIPDILQTISQYDTFLILGHEDPDGDSLGSQLALGSWLERLGKRVCLCSPGNWKRPEIADWQNLFESVIPDFEENLEVVSIIVDCSSWERTGYPSGSLPDGPLILIDHHASNATFGDILYLNPKSPSTTLLIQRIIESSGATPNLQEAEYIFLGFCTDTGFFRHLTSDSAEVFDAVGRLVALGVSPGKTFRKISGKRTLGSRKLLGRALDRTELYIDGRVAFTWEHWKDWREVGSLRDSDMLYQMLMAIKGVEAVIFMREQNDGNCRVSLRSTTDLDVSTIAGLFGGGGHKKASGCIISGDRHDVIENLLPIFADRLE